MMLKLKKLSLKCLFFLLESMVAVLVVDVLLGVFSRYVWGEQVKWTEELATVLLVWVSFLGIAAAFESRAHLGIDFLTSRFAADAGKRLSLVVHLLTIAFVVITFLFGGIYLVRQALVNMNVLPALQVSDVIMYLPLPVSGVFILIYEFGNLFSDWNVSVAELKNGEV